MGPTCDRLTDQSFARGVLVDGWRRICVAGVIFRWQLSLVVLHEGVRQRVKSSHRSALAAIVGRYLVITYATLGTCMMYITNRI